MTPQEKLQKMLDDDKLCSILDEYLSLEDSDEELEAEFLQLSGIKLEFVEVYNEPDNITNNVIKLDDDYYERTGYYDSWDGTEWDELRPVKRVQKTIWVYE